MPLPQQRSPQSIGKFVTITSPFDDFSTFDAAIFARFARLFFGTNGIFVFLNGLRWVDASHDKLFAYIGLYCAICLTFIYIDDAVWSLTWFESQER